MRVLITSPVFPPDLGGPAVYVPAVAGYLVERGHQVEVVAFGSEPRPSGWPFEVEIVERVLLPLRYARVFFAVLRRAVRADAVYVNDHLALLHVLAARLRRKPVMIRIMVDGAWEISHRKGWIGGDDIEAFHHGSYGLRVRMARAAQRWQWSLCDRIIACSNYLRKLALFRYGVPEEKVHLVYNAYNGPRRDEVVQTPEQAREELGLPAGKRWLLTICRLVVWKGVDGILRALAGLPEDVHLLVAGEGGMRAEWTALAAEIGLAERVQFLGNVPYERVPLLIRAADVFVLGSEYEGLSHALLEVSALGTAIVATRVGGNPEVVEHEANGLLVPPRDPEALRAALERLLADPELRRRYAACGLSRMDRFRADASYLQIERALHELAGLPFTPPAYVRPPAEPAGEERASRP